MPLVPYPLPLAKMSDFKGKTAAVIGLARAGVPAARFLAERGARVLGFDSKAREALSEEARALEDAGVELVLGDHGFAGIGSCDLIVLSPGLKVHHEPLESLIAAAEAAGAEVIGELELASRFCPSPMVAVTGTKGKSTTVKLITEMLRACGVDAYSAGNTGTPLISMLPNLSAESWAVVEVSSFQLEKAPTFRPKVAVLLSLLEDHQDYHPTLEQYWETKLKLFQNQHEDDWAVFNCDDKRVEAQAQAEPPLGGSVAQGVWTSGRNLADSEALEFDVFWQNDVLKVRREGGAFPVVSLAQVPLYGAHNRANLSAAVAAVVSVIGLEEASKKTTAIAHAIENFQPLSHRLEIVARQNGITWVNDSQSTIPDATMAALRAFPAPVTLIAGGRSKLEGAYAYDGLGREIFRTGARLLLIGEATEQLAQSALREGVPESKIIRAETLNNAVKIAKMGASDGETIILSPACASFDQFTSYEARGEAFRNAVHEVLS